VRRDVAALEPGLANGRRAMAFNLTVLSNLLGTLIEPDFTGAELLIEDVAEHEYRIDRAMFHVTGSPSVRRASAIRMGRMSEIPENDPVFGSDAESIVRDWCERSGIAFDGRADIGHDSANRVVPFKILSN
jgi:muramoyltetrapeptide carboxypeptidase